MADFRTISYDAGAGRPLALDIFEPERAEDRVAVLIFHGGGFRVGARAAVHNRAAALQALGFVAIAAEYRLLGEAPWPAAFEDALAALEWVKSHASELQIDADRVVLQGHSAGGQLALLTAARAGAAAVVVFYPPIGLHPALPPDEPEPAPSPGGRPVIRPIPQAADGTSPSYNLFDADQDVTAIRAASPIHQLHASFPPTVIFHGASDALLLPFSSVLLYERLRELGVVADLHLYDGQFHEFDLAPSMLDITMREAALFIRRTVSERERHIDEARTFNPIFAGQS